MTRRRTLHLMDDGEGGDLAYYVLRDPAGAVVGGGGGGDDHHHPPNTTMNDARVDGAIVALPPPPPLSGLIIYSLPGEEGLSDSIVDSDSDVVEGGTAAAAAAAAPQQHAKNSTGTDAPHLPPPPDHPEGGHHVESPRLVVVVVDDPARLRTGGQLDVYSLEELHTKSSVEKDGDYMNQDDPARWLPPTTTDDDEVEGAPRAPDDGSDGHSAGGGAVCEGVDGRFGYSGGGGAQGRDQYEITEDVTAVTSAGLAGVLPGLESAIASAMLPVFFGEECLDDGGSMEGDDGTVTEEGGDEDENGGGTRTRTKRRRRRRRGLRGTMGLRAGDTAKVVGIDSRPEDFPLYDRGERPDRTDLQKNCCLFPPAPPPPRNQPRSLT